MTLTLFTNVATSRLKTATLSLALDARSAKKAISGMTLTTHATIVTSRCASNAMPNSLEKTSSRNALLAKMELHLLPISSNKKRNGESMFATFQVDRLSTAEFIMFITHPYVLTVVMIQDGTEHIAILVMRLFQIADIATI